MIVDEEAYLDHHGIKGQKWGIRRQHLREARENFARNSNRAISRQDQRRYNPSLSEADYKRLGTKDFVIKKGSTLKRISSDPKTPESNVFVSTNEQDATNYRALAATWSTPSGLPEKSYKDHYETTFKASRDLTSPSEKKRVDAYIRLMDQKAIKLNNGETITGKEYLKRQGLGSTIDGLTNRDVALKYYGQLVVHQGMKDEPISSAYFNEMKKRGYGAISDDNDSGIFSKTPMAVLNSKDLSTVSVKRLTSDDLQDAIRKLKVP